jgi:DNA-binding CsgD family transcriptional regulator
MTSGSALLHVLETAHDGCLLLDRTGSVLAFNESAERCLSRHGADKVRHGPADVMWATKALTRILGGLPIDAGEIRFLNFRLIDDRSLVLYRIGLTEPLSNGAAAALIIIDLNEHAPLDPDVICRLFELTQAEALLAVLLATGESLRSIAGRQEIALGTARRHLKSILSKTNTHRQAELVALLTRLSSIPSLLLDGAGAASRRTTPAHSRSRHTPMIAANRT